MGIVANLGGPILGLFVAPLLLVKIASTYGWRAGFFVVALPGLLCAVLVATLVREPAAAKESDNAFEDAPARRGRLAEVLQYRNIYICAAICCFYVAYLNLGTVFYPLYYTNIRHLTVQHMSFLMALLGISAGLFGVLVPALSDRFGRKPMMILSSALGVLCPLTVIYFAGPIGMLAGLVFFFWSFSGSGSILGSTIPSETVHLRTISTAMGLIYAVGMIGGGLVGPAIAGWGADNWGLKAVLVLQAVCAAGAMLASIALRETAPRQLLRRASKLEPRLSS
jgi:MFS family permease